MTEEAIGAETLLALCRILLYACMACVKSIALWGKGPDKHLFVDRSRP